MTNPNLAERVQLKFYATDHVPAMDLIPVFHKWITDKVIDDELMIDVADYSHVDKGPGVVLIGHASDYYYDLGEGRPGLKYSRKRGGNADATLNVADAFKRALTACVRLQKESGLSLAFSAQEALFSIQDRLHAPNDDATFDAFKATLEPIAKKALGDVTLTREGDARLGLTIRIRAQGAGSMEDAAARL